MERAFVTGGSGFVGRTLIRVLRERGAHVRALARTESAAEAVEKAGAERVSGSLEDPGALNEGVPGSDVVFHAAAKVDDWGDPDQFHRVNVLGTERLLQVARAAGVRRFVHVSTEAVLAGSRPIVNADESWPLPDDPVGLYPQTKGEAERRVLAAGAGGALETVIVRPRLVWGKGDTSVLPKLEKAVRNGSFAWIDGGRYRTSTCHVRNVAEGTVLAAERGRPGAIYFLTDGEPVEFRRFVTALLRTRDLEPGDRTLPRWVAKGIAWGAEVAWKVLPLRGSPPLTRTAVRLIGGEVTVSDAKARVELGYRPVVTLEEGLAQMGGSF